MINDLAESPQKSPIQTVPGKKKVIVISGPTGTGKTHLSLQLARLLGGEIVSADSMQVYKKMDIGTAKIREEERCGIPHHLIDIRNLSDMFNVVDFYNEATDVLDSIHARGNVPIVVGGTGFYIHSLIYGPPQGPPASAEIRKKLEEDMDKFGPEPLYDKLCTLDPDYARMITRGDRQKIIRAFEIIMQTQKPVSEFLLRSQASRSSEYHFRCWFIYQPKEILYPRIEMRCDEMIAEGLLDEVETLKKEGLENNLSAAQSIGYRQALDYFKSPKDQKAWDQFVSDFKKASRRYAKRQFTWFRKEPLFRWLDLSALPEEKALEIILHDFESAL
ncbi:MAG: tRNA (adenosine(37)-N6)-dimethylallyltransferase MiaA [Simkaniaceae bacterium]|nr:tRNA (adenosine(37)-N6)-dimethylallyltransferase MiaA [Simkaniaceae bacterium]